MSDGHDALMARNAELESISQAMFGEGMRLQIVTPESLVLLKNNARFFKRETFRQLRDNIAADKRLSSVPLCYRHEDGSLEVLSGNHRVQASIEAGLAHILVLVITEKLEKSRRIAIQLSHNSLVGEDDQSILANLWAQVESVQDKLYSGLDSEMFSDLGQVELVNFSTPQVPAHMVTFMFTDGEREKLSELLDLLADAAGKSSEVHCCKGSQYAEFVKLIADVKHAEKIRDSSLAMTRLIEICAAAIIDQALLDHGREVVAEINQLMPNLLSRDQNVGSVDEVAERYNFESTSDLVDYLKAYTPRGPVEEGYFEMLLNERLHEYETVDEVPF